jgi:hypothetical protein
VKAKKPKALIQQGQDVEMRKLTRVPGGILISEGDPWAAFDEDCRNLDNAFFSATA